MQTIPKMNEVTSQQATSRQPSLRMKSLTRKQSQEMMQKVADLISREFFDEGSQASLVQDDYKTDCVFMLPSGSMVRILVQMKEEIITINN